MGKQVNPKECKVENCKRIIIAKGYCMLHYARVRRTGKPGPAEPHTSRMNPHKEENVELLKEKRKRCAKCNRVKGLHLFYKRGEHQTGKCKSCKKDEDTSQAQLKGAIKKYGLSVDDFQALLDYDDGCCWICGGKSTRRLAVDHNHENGNVRGLLCMRCNGILARWKDDPEIALKAFTYLKQDGRVVQDLLGRQPRGSKRLEKDEGE